MRDMNDLSELLESLNSTCIILEDNQVVFTSKDFGVKPLLDFLHSHKAIKGKLTLVDKIVGKGAACLAAKCGIEEIITPTISESALTFAKSHQIKIKADKIVPYIVNRTRDGRCPVESAVETINDIQEAYKVIMKTLEILKRKQAT